MKKYEQVDDNTRWEFKDNLVWPYSKSDIGVTLQKRVKGLFGYRWKSVGFNTASSPGQITWIKQVVLDTPRLDAERAREKAERERQTREFFS